MDDPTEEPLYEMILSKVLWGEPREEVFHRLSVNGITGERAERMYAAAWEERLTVIRRDYARKAGLGLLLLIGAAAIFGYFWLYAGAISRNVVIALVAMVGVGGWKAIDGIGGMLMAGSKEGSVADDA